LLLDSISPTQTSLPEARFGILPPFILNAKRGSLQANLNTHIFKDFKMARLVL